MPRVDHHRPYRHDDLLGLALRVLDVVLRRFGIVLSSYRPTDPVMQETSHSERREVFDAVYRRNMWRAEETRSGQGSTQSYTATYRAELTAFIRDFGIDSLFDAPCGDVNWIAPIVTETGISYVGGDISPEVVAAARQRQPSLDIREFDICSDEFPDCDAWHCRDCLFHLSFEDIAKAMRRFAASNAKYALLTTHRARILHNVDIPTGSFRWLDLERSPLRLPRPLRYLKDYRTGLDFPRYVGVWERNQIAAALSERVAS